MVSGYVLRNGQSGTDNLTATRATIPAWAQRVYTVAAAQAGPPVNTTYPLGRYMEDKAYLADLGRTQGTDFDLDEYNGRYCVTPEFPNGTYAYFVAINADGSPAYPYNIGRAFYGSPTGAAVTSITETVTTTFQGAAALQEQARLSGISPGTDNVALTWSSVEGGTYRVEAGSDLTTWTSLTSTQTASPNAVETTYSEAGAGNTSARRFYRVTRTALAAYDPVTGTTGGGGGGTGILTVSPASGTRGSTFTLTINLDPSVNPALPPANAPVNSVTLGTTSSTSRVHVSQTQVTAQFTLPAGAATGPQTVTVVFPGPPNNPTAAVTYTLNNGFAVN